MVSGPQTHQREMLLNICMRVFGKCYVPKTFKKYYLHFWQYSFSPGDKVSTLEMFKFSLKCCASSNLGKLAMKVKHYHFSYRQVTNYLIQLLNEDLLIANYHRG